MTYRGLNFKRILSSSICLLLIISLICGCGSESSVSSDAASDNLTPITVGMDIFKPYSYINTDGEFAGIDIDIATEAFARIGYRPEYKIIKWEDKANLLEAGEIDCIWSGFSMNGREDEYQWVGPYLYSYQVVAVRANSDINTVSDLAGKRVGVQISTKAAALFLHDEEGDVVIPEMNQVNCYTTTEEFFAALRKGYVDAIAGHGAVIRDFISGEGDNYRILDEPIYHSELGVAFAKGTHEELASELAGTIEEMRQDGTLEQIAAAHSLDVEQAVWGGDVNE